MTARWVQAPFPLGLGARDEIRVTRLRSAAAEPANARGLGCGKGFRGTSVARPLWGHAFALRAVEEVGHAVRQVFEIPVA